MAKEKQVRSGSAMHGSSFNGKGSWDRADNDAVKTRKENLSSLDWLDHDTSKTLDKVKSENGKTVYKIKI